MSKLHVNISVTLDGVMQAPGRSDEDTRGAFAHGGWAVPYADGVAAQEMAKRMANTVSLLLGRRTYEDFASFWPKQPDNPYTDVLNNTQKYVVSSTLTEPLPWQHSTLVHGDPATAIGRLKERQDKDIVVLGSGNLLQTLLQHELVDSYTLLLHPLALGSGRHLFPDGYLAELQLVNSVATTTGVIIATYQPA